MSANAASRDSFPRLPASQRILLYLLETRAQFLSVWRRPAFSIPTLAFPVLFYVFFGIVMASGGAPGGAPGGVSAAAPTYLLATYGVFAVLAPSLFGFGVGVAVERDSGALALKQTTPMPAGAYFFARVATALLFGVLLVTVLFLLGAYAGGVALPRGQWFLLAGAILAGVLPFSALGLLIGSWARGQAAVAIVNVVFLPMALLSGLWFPITMFPGFLQSAANLFPAYHLSQLALKVVALDAGQPPAFHLAVLVGETVVCLAVAALGFRRFAAA